MGCGFGGLTGTSRTVRFLCSNDSDDNFRVLGGAFLRPVLLVFPSYLVQIVRLAEMFPEKLTIGLEIRARVVELVRVSSLCTFAWLVVGR